MCLKACVRSEISPAYTEPALMLRLGRHILWFGPDDCGFTEPHSGEAASFAAFSSTGQAWESVRKLLQRAFEILLLGGAVIPAFCSSLGKAVM